MHTFEFAGLKRLIPSAWNELSRGEFLLVCRLFEKKIPVSEFKQRILFKTLRVKWKTFARLNPENLYFAGEKLSFILEKVSLTKNLLPVLRPGIFRVRCFHGPSDGMRHSTFEEFINAQVLFDAYLKNNDENSLCSLIACLYRPRKIFWPLRRRFSKSEEHRKAFSKKKLLSRSKRFARLDAPHKLAVRLFLMGVFNALPQYFPNIFRSRKEFSSAGWPALIISLADGKADDVSLERVLQSNMYNVLLSLDQRAKEYYEFLEQMEK